MGVQTRQPVTDYIFSCSGDIPTNLDHASNVSYKLQPRKPESDPELRCMLATFLLLLGGLCHKSLGGYASSLPLRIVRVDAAQPRLGRSLRTAPVSRQTKPNPVCHSPRFHSHPATLTSLRSVPFTVPSVFVRWRSSEEQKQAGNGRKEKQ
jgi:hypothetical protein